MRNVLATMFMFALPVLILAQAPKSFEVASVQRHKPGDPGGTTNFPPGRYIATNLTVRSIIQRAYQVQYVQIVGGPSWIETDRFDIDAKAPTAVPPDQMLPMIQSLLADRFHLVVHHEQRPTSVYALVMARSDGKPGPQLLPFDCSDPAVAKAHPCNLASVGIGHVSEKGVTMSRLGSGLAALTGRFVVDHTGLAGTYDAELTWTPEPSPPNAAPTTGAPATPAEPSGPSIFTALQEQLGLKLESRKEPVDTIVIDSIQQPSED